MSKIDDMDLFVHVVKADGLAAAGRQIGLSPASMTARINAIEARYNSRLLNRTTRKISLTDAGQRFYNACLRVLTEVETAEALLHNDKTILLGSLRITAPADFGRQFIVPALAQFIQLHPAVVPYLYLGDGVINLVENGFDLGIRYGNLSDSSLMVRRLADNHRVLVASPNYLQEYGVPQKPKDLEKHRCLVLERIGEPLNEWQFTYKNRIQTIRVNPTFMCNDGDIIRLWALSGCGIAYKSIWDVQNDIDEGNLQTLLDDYVLGFQNSDHKSTGLQLLYPSRKYIPRQVSGFMDFLTESIEVP